MIDMQVIFIRSKLSRPYGTEWRWKTFAQR